MNTIIDQFDEWAVSRELNITKHPNPMDGWIYSDIETQMFWECWLASRVVMIGLYTNESPRPRPHQ